MTRRLTLITAAILSTLALAAGWWFTHLAEAHLDSEAAELQASTSSHVPTRHAPSSRAQSGMANRE